MGALRSWLRTGARALALAIGMLIAAGQPTVLLATGGDSTPPKLVSESFTPTSIDVSSASQVVTFQVHATDDLSGVKSVFVHLTPPPPSNTAVGVESTQLIAGTILDGTWQVLATFPQYSPSGIWHLDTIGLYDNAGNASYVYESALIAAGQLTTISVTGGDSTPPKLVSESFTPTSIDVSSASQVVTFQVHATDDLSGVKSVFVHLTPPPPSNTAVGVESTQLIAGTILDGTWQVLATFPQYSPSGIWHLDTIGLHDNAGNASYVYESALIAAGQLTTISVTGGDSTPPKLVSESFTPTSIDVSSASQVVTFQVHATDDLSGVKSVFVHLTPPPPQQYSCRCREHPVDCWHHPRRHVAGIGDVSPVQPVWNLASGHDRAARQRGQRELCV